MSFGFLSATLVAWFIIDGSNQQKEV
jgi:hypothetical protein